MKSMTIKLVKQNWKSYSNLVNDLQANTKLIARERKIWIIPTLAFWGLRHWHTPVVSFLFYFEVHGWKLVLGCGSLDQFVTDGSSTEQKDLKPKGSSIRKSIPEFPNHI